MKIVEATCMGEGRISVAPETKPAPQSGLDIASNPKLLRRKRGLVAVAHSLLLVIYHILQRASEYRDLGRDFLDRMRADHLIRFHVKRLQQLGLTVTLAPAAA